MMYFICTYTCVNACVREVVEDGITNDGEPPDMGAGDQALSSAKAPCFNRGRSLLSNACQEG